MAKSSPSKRVSPDFGDFTRNHVVDVLKKSSQADCTVSAIMAATLLASIDVQGPSPRDIIATALDVLANSKATVAHDLLWQAAEHARNPRIRVEAIRRSGSTATPKRSALLRQWAREGFQPSINLQHDQIDLNCIKNAAIHAIGNIKNPTADDVETILATMTPPENMAEFSAKLFSTACEAYWSAGNKESLPILVELISKRWRPDIGFPLIALAAKFTAKELKPHFEPLRKILCDSTGDWPSNKVQTDRLIILAQRLRSPEFFQDWASQYNREGLEHGRGQVTTKLLEGFKRPSSEITNGLLSLARCPHNLSTDGIVVKWLAKCVEAGYGKLIAQKVVAEHSDGYSELLTSGMFYTLYNSVDVALTDICASLSSIQNENQRYNIAGEVATGTLAVICDPGQTADSSAKTARRDRGRDDNANRELLADQIGKLEQSDASLNPFAIVARLLSPPISAAGAFAVCECWLPQGELIARYVIQNILREAGRAQAFGKNTPMLVRFEQRVLASKPQQPSLKPILEAALISEAVIDGQLNRYAIDLMMQNDLSFERGTESALPKIKTEDDAKFLLRQLHDKGAIDVLTKSICYHQDGNERLTTYVRATVISLVPDLLKHTEDKKRRDTFAAQLHDRFEDVLDVRKSAYQACSEIGSFCSIKPLRTQLSQETASSGKKAIEQAINVLRKRLIEEKPQQGSSETIRQWLDFVADLGDPSLLQYVVGYLRPLHADQTVQHAALNAVEHMPSPEALEMVKNFITDMALKDQTLAIARHVQLVLEQRRDSDLFDVLSNFYPPHEEILDTTIDYAKLLDTLLPVITKGLKKSLKLFADEHWDEYVARISGLMESITRLLFRRRFDVLGIDEERANKIADGHYRNLLNVTEFRSTCPMLHTHCNTIYTYRAESSAAHATNTDGSAKYEATSDKAECVRDEFKRAFVEAINALR